MFCTFSELLHYSKDSQRFKLCVDMSQIGRNHTYEAMDTNFADLTRFKQVSVDNLQDEEYAKILDYKMVVAYVLILKHITSGIKAVSRTKQQSIWRASSHKILQS